jgi:hypothetical protein
VETVEKEDEVHFELIRIGDENRRNCTSNPRSEIGKISTVYFGKNWVVGPALEEGLEQGEDRGGAKCGR